MIGAIIVGLIVPLVYCWFLKKNIRIKMPAGVPEGVTNAFSALIPAFVILTGTAVIQVSVLLDSTQQVWKLFTKLFRHHFRK